MYRNMLEVRKGVLLGSTGDALAAITRVASITKTHTITHLLTIANQPLDWYLVEGQQHDKEEHKEPTTTDGEGTTERVGSEPGDGGGVAGEGVVTGACGVEVEMGGARKGKRCGFTTMFVCLPDMPSSDLLQHFEQCCLFIRDAVEQRGTILVHW